MSRETLGLLLGLVGVIVFGGSLPMTRLAVAHIDPLFVTFARPGLAGLLAAAVLLAMRRPWPAKPLLIRLVLASVALVWGWPGLTNFAMVTVPASHGGVVAGLLPLATAVAASLILREPQSLRFWAIAVAGAALVTGFALRDGGGTVVGGDLLMLMAVAICSGGYVIAGSLSRDMPGWEVISWMLVLALPLSLPGMLWTWPANLAAVPAPSLAGFVYITLLSQYLGFFAWNAGLAMGGVARVSQVQLLQTFVTLGFAALLLGERVDPVTWAVALIVVALVLLGKREAGRGRG
jgi:drug/metabolite transporter (DMT)-like permease